MQETSTLYKTLLAGRHKKEIMLKIAGVEYREPNIVSISTSGRLFEELSVGNAVSRLLDMRIFPIGDIPRQAQVEIYVRLTNGAETSEWIPQGVFFFSRREMDKRTGVMTVQGFDAMLKTEQTWLDSSYDTENWPMSPAYAVADIAARMGVEVDARTTLSENFPVQYPVDEEGDMTMREVLQRLAVANSGNWIITETGKLRLIPLASIPAETSYLVTEDGDAIVIGGLRLIV